MELRVGIEPTSNDYKSSVLPLNQRSIKLSGVQFQSREALMGGTAFLMEFALQVSHIRVPIVLAAFNTCSPIIYNTINPQFRV